MNRGRLIVVSGPSGVGKDTVVSQFLGLHPEMQLSISATTRAPRAGEQDGVNYYFATREQFEDAIENDRMLEYAQYNGFYYGTPRQRVEELLEAGVNVFLIIEVKGALLIKQKFPEALLIFFLPPSMQALRARLEGRGTETADSIAKRLKIVDFELSKAPQYDYIVVNDELSRSVELLEDILQAERHRAVRMQETLEEVRRG